MKITRIYTGDDGRSHFEEFEAPLRANEFGRFTRGLNAEGVVFRETDAGYSLDFHNAPRRQFVVTLSGSAEIECGSGDKRLLGPGAILLADDTTGQGHISREVDSPRVTVFIPLGEDFDLEQWRTG